MNMVVHAYDLFFYLKLLVDHQLSVDRSAALCPVFHRPLCLP